MAFFFLFKESKANEKNCCVLSPILKLTSDVHKGIIATCSSYYLFARHFITVPLDKLFNPLFLSSPSEKWGL